MALPQWRQAGGQVKASKITGFDTAFNPLINQVKRITDAQNRKDAAESDMKFRSDEALKRREFQTARDNTQNTFKVDAAALANDNRTEAAQVANANKVESDRLIAAARKEQYGITNALNNARLNETKRANSVKEGLATKRFNLTKEAHRLNEAASKQASTSRIPLGELPTRFTGKTIIEKVTEEERVATGTKKFVNANVDRLKKAERLFAGVESKYNIRTMEDLNKAIDTQKKLTKKDGSKYNKEVLSDLLTASVARLSYDSGLKESIASQPKTRKVQEKTIDYIKGLEKFYDNVDKNHAAIYDGDGGTASKNQAIKRFNLGSKAVKAFLERGASQQQRNITKQIDAEIKTKQSKLKKKDDLDMFIAKEKARMKIKKDNE